MLVLCYLRKSYKLCLVSDAWPLLRHVYKKAGIYKYFDSIIISSELDVTKLNEQIYKIALKELGLRGIILNRNFIMRSYTKIILKVPYKILNDLYELERLITLSTLFRRSQIQAMREMEEQKQKK